VTVVHRRIKLVQQVDTDATWRRITIRMRIRQQDFARDPFQISLGFGSAWDEYQLVAEWRWMLRDRVMPILVLGVPLLAIIVLTAVFSHQVMRGAGCRHC